MAKKPFEIQGTDLKLGGVSLQAGDTGVVIPGVTQATNYRVKEVEDTDVDQTVTFSSAPTIIDYVTFNDYNVNGTSSGRATYSCELDDGYIDDIEVDSAGSSYTAIDADENESSDMRAYTGSAGDPFASFDQNDWTPIPFRPKMRAGQIQTIGGGGSSALEGLDDVQLDGVSDGQVLTWNAGQEKWENQDPSGGGNANTGNITFNENTISAEEGGSVNIQSDDYAQLESNDNYVWVDTDGVHVEVDGGGSSEFIFKWDGSKPVLQLPADGDIVDSAGVSVLGGGTTPGEAQGYFNELTVGNRKADGEAVVIDPDGSSYISYSYYDDNEGKNFGGVIKFDSSGTKVWSVNVIPQNADADYTRISSLEYSTILNAVVALGNYYDNNTGKDVGFMYFINSDGTTGGSTDEFNTETTTSTGMRVNDAVFGEDSNGNPFAVLVGETYDQNLDKTITPLSPSRIDRVYASRSEITALNVIPGEQLYYYIGGYFAIQVNAADITASPTGYDSGLNLKITATAAGQYEILRVNGWSGDVYSWSAPVTLRVLGHDLGGVSSIVPNISLASVNTSGGNVQLNISKSVYPNLDVTVKASSTTATYDGNTYNVTGVSSDSTYWLIDLDTTTTTTGGVVTFNNAVHNDMTFDFNNTIFNNNSNNISAAVSNISGTPISDVYCSGYGGKDWSTEIGNTLTVQYRLNNQGYVGRLGSNSWTKTLGAGDYDTLNSVVVDSSGNVYIAGNYYVTNKSGLVAKFDESGSQQWAVHIDSINNMGNEIHSIDLADNGSLYTVDDAGTVTKLNSSDGAIIWQVTIDDNPDWDGDFKGTVTPDGDYIISNYEYDEYTTYVVKLNGTDGSVAWSKRFSRVFNNNNGEVIVEDDFDAQFIDASSTYFTLAGTTQSPDGDEAGLVISLPIDGDWSGTYGQYVVTDESLNWTTETTTSTAVTLNDSEFSVTTSFSTPAASSVSMTVNQTSLSGASSNTGTITFDGDKIMASGSDADQNFPLGRMTLVPNSTTNNHDYEGWGQYIDIYPTTTADEPHIHIAAGKGNYSTGDLVLGDDNYHVNVHHEGFVRIQTYDSGNYNTQQWTFGYNGELSFPGNLNTFDKNIDIIAMNAGSAGDITIKTMANYNNVHFSMVQLTQSGITLTTDMDTTPGGKSFEFRDTGILVLPSGGDIQDASGNSLLGGGGSGTQGIQGIQGADGLQGIQGADGLQGLPGPDGAPGVPGMDGAPGNDGLQGIDGAQGTQGLQGLIGPVAGSDTQVIFNNSNSPAGSSNLTWNNTSNTLSTTDISVSGSSSNIIRRAYGLVASDTYVTLDDLKARVTSSTNQLSLMLTSGSWQGTGWTETFQGGGTPTVNNWINLPLSTGFDSASGAMSNQGNGCRCVISDQTPSAKVYQITVVRSGTTGNQWNISIERLV